MVPADLRYTEEHEWVRVENESAIIGITSHAAEELGEIVFCDLPDEGDDIEQMAEFGSIESVKTVSSLFSPVTGTIEATNGDVVDNPSNINDSPYDDGWLIKVALSDLKEVDDLMTADEYQDFLDNSE